MRGAVLIMEDYRKEMEELAKRGKEIEDKLASKDLRKEERDSLEVEYEKVFDAFQTYLGKLMLRDSIEKCDIDAKRKETEKLGYIL